MPAVLAEDMRPVCRDLQALHRRDGGQSAAAGVLGVLLIILTASG